MNLQRREEISALLAAPVTGGAGQVLEYRDALMECRAHIDALEQAAAERVIADGSRGPGEAPAVVVPDDDRPSREFLENYVEGFDPGERSAALFGWREGRRHLREHSRAIPASRVLGEGMVAVDREEWRAINEFADMIVPIRDNLSGISWVGKLSDVFEAYDQWYAIRIAAGVALRANQGGVAA